MPAHKCVFIKVEGKCICQKCNFTISGDCSKLFKDCLSNSEIDKYPSILQIASNVAISTVNFITSCGKIELKEEQERRLEICKSCPFYDSLQNRCKKCGCYMNFKTMLSSESCPEGKW